MYIYSITCIFNRIKYIFLTYKHPNQHYKTAILYTNYNTQKKE